MPAARTATRASNSSDVFGQVGERVLSAFLEALELLSGVGTMSVFYVLHACLCSLSARASDHATCIRFHEQSTCA